MVSPDRHSARRPAAWHPTPAARGLRRIAIVVIASAAAVYASSAVGVGASAQPVLMPQLATLAEPSATTMRDAIVARLDELRSATAAATDELDASEGKVLDETARTGLAQALREADAVVVAAQQQLIWPDGALPAASGEAVYADLADVGASVDAGVTAVTESVDAWTAEQARLAAEEEARRAAERAAASRPGVARAAAPAGATGGLAVIESIWTSGGQAEIDACRGSVDMPDIASYLGGGFYAAEHWRCGGSAWGGVGAGAIVQFPGYGVYQVVGRVGGLVYGVDASAVPAGYDGYYQTCIGGSSSNMTVWLLSRVG
ncbi:MAG: hypothetical protein DI534_00360 [Leifsonia xyli]|nr:MAG: hypothetical protein DI534_00360 [Leifsonia xyli]